MPALLSRVPLPDAAQTVSFGPHEVVVHARQPVVWVSLKSWGREDLLHPVPFPVVVDTGNNHSMFITEGQFRDWVGADLTPARTKNCVELGAIEVPCYVFNVVLHRLRRGKPIAEPAGVLQTDIGIAVVPPAALVQLRLPTIGIRCFTTSRFDLLLYGRSKCFTIRTSPRPRGRGDAAR